MKKNDKRDQMDGRGNNITYAERGKVVSTSCTNHVCILLTMLASRRNMKSK
jgi:hypothetical protein